MAPRTVAAALAGEALFWRLSQLGSQPGRSGLVIRGRIRQLPEGRDLAVAAARTCVLLFSAGARLPRSTRGPTLYNYAPRRIPAPRRRGSLFSRSLKLSLSRALSLLPLSRSLSLFSPTPQRVDTPTPTSPPKLHCCSLGLDCGYGLGNGVGLGRCPAAAGRDGSSRGGVFGRSLPPPPPREGRGGAGEAEPPPPLRSGRRGGSARGAVAPPLLLAVGLATG